MHINYGRDYFSSFNIKLDRRNSKNNGNMLVTGRIGKTISIKQEIKQILNQSDDKVFVISEHESNFDEFEFNNNFVVHYYSVLGDCRDDKKKQSQLKQFLQSINKQLNNKNKDRIYWLYVDEFFILDNDNRNLLLTMLENFNNHKFILTLSVGLHNIMQLNPLFCKHFRYIRCFNVEGVSCEASFLGNVEILKFFKKSKLHEWNCFIIIDNDLPANIRYGLLPLDYD